MVNQGNIPPEVLNAYMQQLSLEEQDQDFQNQLALSQELMKQGPERYGPIGQGLQTVADLMNAYKGGKTMRSAQAGREALRPQREAGRRTVGEHWLASQNQSMPQGGGEQAIPEPAPALYSYDGMPDESQLIPDMLRRPMEQYAPPPAAPMPSPAPGDLNVGVAPVPPPLDPTVKLEPTADYKKRHQANRPVRG